MQREEQATEREKQSTLSNPSNPLQIQKFAFSYENKKIILSTTHKTFLSRYPEGESLVLIKLIKSQLIRLNGLNLLVRKPI